MSLLQQRRECTVHDGQGGRCGRLDQCTHVVTVNAAGEVLHEHWVCSTCRARMGLPEHSVTLGPSGAEVRRT